MKIQKSKLLLYLVSSSMFLGWTCLMTIFFYFKTFSLCVGIMDIKVGRHLMNIF